MIYLRWRNEMNRIIFTTLLSCFVISQSVYAQDQKCALNLMAGQTVVDDMCTPHGDQIKEAEPYLAEKGVVVPEEIEELCEYYGKRHNIVPELWEAIIFKESRFKPNVADDDGRCKGLMQISTSSHSKRMQKLRVTNIYDPAGNIAVGSDYLHELLLDNDVDVALMLYNGDKRAGKVGYISSYAREVLDISQALERVHYK
jgi:soluble lytic murein transglycosylase-like protein